MAAEWICDGCGKRAPGRPTQLDGWKKPDLWFSRNLSLKEDGTEAGGIFSARGPEAGTFKTILDACSRECIARVAAKVGGHSLVLPV